MSDLSDKEKAVLQPFMTFAYNEGYADALDAACRIVKMLGDRPELVIESLLAGAQDIRHKAPKKLAIDSLPNGPTPPASSSSSENPRA